MVHSHDGIPMGPPSNPEFDYWLLSQTDPDLVIDSKPVPMMTVMLYRICGNDQEKFNFVVRQLQLAFEAGQRT